MMTGNVPRRQFLIGATSALMGCATARNAAPARTSTTPDEIDATPDGLVDLWMGHGPDALRLDKNENPFGPSPRAIEAAKVALEHANRYVNPRALIERIAAQHDVDPTMVQLGAGSGEILQSLPIAFMRDGGNVVTATESYRQLPQAATLLDREVRWVPLREDFAYDVPGMIAAVDASTRLLVVVNPNNPTGSMITRADLLEIVRAIPQSTLLVVDEAYVEFLPSSERSAIDLVREIPNLVVLRTFSKAYGLAGLRLGYAVAQQPVIAELNPAVSSWPNVVAYAGCAAALDDVDHVRRYTAHAERCRGFFREQLGALGLPHQIGYAPVAMARLGRDRVEATMAAMAREGILIRDGKLWGMDDWIRITYGLDRANARVIAVLRG